MFAHRDKYTMQKAQKEKTDGSSMRPKFSVPRKSLLSLLTSVYLPPRCHMRSNIPTQRENGHQLENGLRRPERKTKQV